MALGVGVALPDAAGVADALADADADGVADAVELAVALGVAEPLAVALADGVADPDGPGSGSQRPKISLIGSQFPPPPPGLEVAVAVGLPEAEPLGAVPPVR